ncbi:hypothetical protein B0H17DRAFT_1136217 [Mycena rosella]|uniref:Uncharacterized protein n=1 Tax=Mycena rosella TaxID=1033263 RepID=A0AAD7DCX7_MYCRO|nr:hypothetical protein B0H17DRAFT_1136217 [Mycena rosella]
MARTVKPPVGSYEHDVADGQYTLKWNSLADMTVWLRNEEQTNSIELVCKEPRSNKNKKDHHWLIKYLYVCARQGSGGKSKYVAKNAERVRNIPARQAEDGCPCRLTVKTYPNTPRVLGLYITEHSHPTGDANIIFTRIPLQTRGKIEELLRQGMRPDLVLNQVRGNVHTEDNLPTLTQEPARREEFINSRDVGRIQKPQKKIEAETVRLNRNDGLSTLEWVARLKDAEHQSHPPRPSPSPPSLQNANRPSTAAPADYSDDPLLLDFILHKLQHMKNGKVVPSAALTESLRTLDSTLNAAVGDQMLLPNVKRVAPNMHSWTETAAAMGIPKKVIGATKKGPQKRVHTDAHAGGQGSGKQAQPDARVPKKSRPSVASPSPDVVSTSSDVASTSSDIAPTGLDSLDDPSMDEVPDFFPEHDENEMSFAPELGWLCDGLTAARTSTKSPEEQLSEAFRLYSSMFPVSKELDESQPVVAAPTTSYYRPHLYS